MELATKDIRDAEVREETKSFIERRRDTFEGVRPMDADNHEVESTKTTPLHMVARCRLFRLGRVSPHMGWMEEAGLHIFQVQPKWGKPFKSLGEQARTSGSQGN